MQQVIGVMINGTPLMPALLPDQHIDYDHVMIGLSHSGQAWFADPKQGDYGNFLTLYEEVELTGDVLVCLFRSKIERLQWLRSHSGDDELLDPSVSINEQLALLPPDDDQIPDNIYAAVLECQMLMSHSVGNTSTLAP